jgi:hypothetical protein
MTNATFDDLSEKGEKVIRYDQAYRVVVTNLGLKTEIQFDTGLKTKMGTLQEAIGLALTNGIQWKKITWQEDPETGKKKKIETVVLDNSQDPKK